VMDKANTLTNILHSNKIKADCIEYSDSPNSEYYDLVLQPRGKVSDIRRYLSEISLALKTAFSSLSLITDQGRLRLSIEKSDRPTLHLFSYGSSLQQGKGKLPCLIGQTFQSEPLWLDLADAPHLLVAGTTGSGKSTLIHSIIASLLTHDARLLLIDPKGIEFGAYQSLANVGVSFSFDESLKVLRFIHNEMNERYSRMSKGDYNFPYVAIVIDEFADLISQDSEREFYQLIRKLAQKSRAAKIHIVLATQRPSVDIIDGSIKANFPTRVACKVATMVDSRVILDQPGAEKLIGRGDAILKDANGYTRFQAAFTDAKEVKEYFLAR